MVDLAQFKKSGKPIYVPGGAIKGWEIGEEFMQNPDWDEPVPPPAPKVEPIQLRCQRCGVDIDKPRKAVQFAGGSVRTIICCERCINSII
jgi:hypothetical protein